MSAYRKSAAPPLMPVEIVTDLVLARPCRRCTRHHMYVGEYCASCDLRWKFGVALTFSDRVRRALRPLIRLVNTALNGFFNVVGDAISIERIHAAMLIALAVLAIVAAWRRGK